MFSVKKNWQLQMKRVRNFCHGNNTFRTLCLSHMYCVNLSETSHTHRSAIIMRVLKIRLYEIIVCSCIIYDIFFST